MIAFLKYADCCTSDTRRFKVVNNVKKMSFFKVIHGQMCNLTILK